MPRTTVAPVKVQKFLKGVNYPAKRKQLIETAKLNNADQQVISLLERLKEEDFKSPAEVSRGIGEID